MVPEEKPPKIIDTTPSKLAEKSLGGTGVVPLVTNKNNNSINNSENHAGANAASPGGGTAPGTPGPGGAGGAVGAAGAGAATAVVSNVNGGDWPPVNNTHHQLHVCV